MTARLDCFAVGCRGPAELVTRLRSARLDNTLPIKMQRLDRVDLLIFDDFSFRPLDTTETNDSSS